MGYGHNIPVTGLSMENCPSPQEGAETDSKKNIEILQRICIIKFVVSYHLWKKYECVYEGVGLVKENREGRKGEKKLKDQVLVLCFKESPTLQPLQFLCAGIFSKKLA